MATLWCLAFCCVLTAHTTRGSESALPIQIEADIPANHTNSQFEQPSVTSLYKEKCTNYNIDWFKAHGSYAICSNHGNCVEGKCQCVPEYYGKYCELKKCVNGCVHGRCTPDGQCECDYHYKGNKCDIIRGPAYCSYYSEQYNSVNNTCDCKPGFERNQQSQKCREYHCKNQFDCSAHGECEDKKCVCNSGYSGLRCEKANCMDQSYYDESGNHVVCSNHGSCDGKSCTCEFGYEGDFCQYNRCNNDGVDYCSNHGTCNNSKCECRTGYSGDRCENVASCNDYEENYFDSEGNYVMCSNRGICDNGTCECFDGFGQAFCEIDGRCLFSGYCPNGKCINDQCVCNPGYSGPACNHVNCTEQSYTDDNGHLVVCNNHGSCDGQKCSCNPGFAGYFCNEGHTCHDERDCYFGGSCIDYRCHCKPGYSGYDCATAVSCEEYTNVYGDATGEYVECNNHGKCEDGRCVCDSGYQNEFCEDELDCSYPYACYNRGNCTDRKCICPTGYNGSRCENSVSCDNYGNNYYDNNGTYIVCNGHGTCNNGQCNCEIGYGGEFCENDVMFECYNTYPFGCSYHGVCVNKKCVCDAGFFGIACEKVASCYEYEKNYYDLKGNYVVCNGHGRCDRGNCTCFPGHTGTFCETEMDCTDEYDCNEHGTCSTKFYECSCEKSFFGDHCQNKKDCGPEQRCSYNGECEDGKCVCETGYIGKYCDGKIEDSLCYNSAFYLTANETMANEYSDYFRLCTGRGRCNESRCDCDVGYPGQYCEQPLSYACYGTWDTVRCSGRGECVDRKCVCPTGYIGKYCQTQTVQLQTGGSWWDGDVAYFIVTFFFSVGFWMIVLVLCRRWNKSKRGTSTTSKVQHKRLKETDSPFTVELIERADEKVELEALPSVHLPLKAAETTPEETQAMEKTPGETQAVEKTPDETPVLPLGESALNMIVEEEDVKV